MSAAAYVQQPSHLLFICQRTHRTASKLVLPHDDDLALAMGRLIQAHSVTIFIVRIVGLF